MSGADDAWHNTSVTLCFAAGDDSPGVARTEYALDGGPWTLGISLPVTLTLGSKRKGSNSGLHVVAYRSTDLAATSRPPGRRAS